MHTKHSHSYDQNVGVLIFLCVCVLVCASSIHQQALQHFTRNTAEGFNEKCEAFNIFFFFQNPICISFDTIKSYSTEYCTYIFMSTWHSRANSAWIFFSPLSFKIALSCLNGKKVKELQINFPKFIVLYEDTESVTSQNYRQSSCINTLIQAALRVYVHWGTLSV